MIKDYRTINAILGSINWYWYSLFNNNIDNYISIFYNKLFSIINNCVPIYEKNVY